MSNSIDSLAQLNFDETKFDNDRLGNYISEAREGGQSLQEIVTDFHIPGDEDPGKTLAISAIASKYNTHPSKAASLAYFMKKAEHPNITWIEFAEKVYDSEDGRPVTSIEPSTNLKKMQQVLLGYDQYALDKEKAKEREGEDKENAEAYAALAKAEDVGLAKIQGLSKSIFNFQEQSKPARKKKALDIFNDNFFGRGTEHQRLKKRYFDRLDAARTPEEKQKASEDYVHDLGVEQQYYMLGVAQQEYKIENATWSESFMKRKFLSSGRASIRFVGQLASIAKTALELYEIVSPNLYPHVYDIHHPAVIPYLKNIMRQASWKAQQPELHRVELDWFDGVTNAIIENIPLMATTVITTIAATAIGGPIAGKMAMFWIMGSGEAFSVYTDALANGFTEEEANKRSWIALVVNGGIEVASGGILKYAPHFKHSKGMFTKALQKLPRKMTVNILKETLMEEIPQEVVSAMLSGDVPYKDGKLDWDEITNQVLLVARDAAFMAFVFSVGSKGVEKVGDAAFKAEHGYSKQALAYAADELEQKMVQQGKDPGVNGLVAHSKAFTEELNRVNVAPRYYLKKLADGTYEVWDADKKVRVDKEGNKLKKGEKAGYSLDEASEISDNANLNQPLNNPVTQLLRFVDALIANGDKTPIYKEVSRMLNPRAKQATRVSAAIAIKGFVKQLRADLIDDVGLIDAELEIPYAIEEALDLIPHLWEKGRIIRKGAGGVHMGFIKKQEKLDAVNELLHVMRIGQKWGKGDEADRIRNEAADEGTYIKSNKHFTPPAKPPNWLQQLYDMTLGTSKDDLPTSLLHMLGMHHIHIALRMEAARTEASTLNRKMQAALNKKTQELKIDNNKLRLWSGTLAHIWNLPNKIPLMMGGVPVQLTMGEIMEVSLALRDQRVLGIIEDQGIELKNIEYSKLSDWEKRTLLEALAKDKQAEAMVDVIWTFYIEERGAGMNKASQKERGHNIVTKDQFLPDNRKTDDKGRKTGPYVIRDIFRQTSEDIRQAANYIKIKPFSGWLLRILNDKGFRRTAKDNGKSRHLDRAIESTIAMNKARPHQATPLERAMSRLGANRARSILVNLRIVALQVGSFQLYLNQTDAKHMLPTKVPDILKKQYAFLINRTAGQGSTHSVVSDHNVRNQWLGNQPTDIAMLPMHLTDLKTTGRSLNIAFSEMMSENMGDRAMMYWSEVGLSPAELRAKGIDSVEFKDALFARATHLAYTTQPMFFPESRNQYIQQETGFLREIARFRAFTDQLLRNNGRQIALWQMGEISSREMATNVGMNIAWASFWYNSLKLVFMSMLNLFKDDKKEMDLIFEFLTGPLSWIPFLGWTLKGGVNKLVHPDSYGPADFSTITVGQLDHIKDSGMFLVQAISFSLTGETDRYGNSKAQMYWVHAMRSIAEDVFTAGLGLPTYLIDVIPDKEFKTKKDSRVTY